MSDEAMSKEEKLEAARKKFEEMKQNKKKGKKKNKKTKSEPADDTATVDEGKVDENNTSIDVLDNTNERNDGLKNSKDSSENNAEEVLNDDTKTANDILEETNKDNDTDLLRPDIESTREGEREDKGGEEGKKDEGEEGEESKIVVGSETEEKHVEPSQDTEKQSNVEISNSEEIQEAEQKFDIKSQDQQLTDSEIMTEGSLKENDEKKSSFDKILEGNTHKDSDFLSETLKSTIQDLQKENDKLQSEVSTLKSDNLELKLVKMDLEMELETIKNELESQKDQVKRLAAQLSKSKTDFSSRIKSSDDDDGMSVLSGTEYLHHSPSSFANLTNFNMNNSSQDYMDIVDVKQRLAQWKGWNMDMHGWRSIGMGSVVDF